MITATATHDVLETPRIRLELLDGGLSAPALLPSASTMTSAVIAGPRRFELRSEPVPDPGPHEVRVRLEGCGVCGSNLPVWEGRSWFRYPLEPGAPGHEGWGVVDAVGSEVDDFRGGERVALLSQQAFREFDVADARRVVRLPAVLDGHAFPGEALGCAMNVFRRSDIRPGQRVAVVGAGFLGAVLVSLASRAGARVLALVRRPVSGLTARHMGADEVISMEDPVQAVNEVREATRGEGCERVIEATGFQVPLDIAGEVCRERGRLVIAGYHQDGLRQVNLQSWNWKGLDVVNAHERDPEVYLEGMREAVRAVADGGLDPAPLFTHEFSIEQIGRALDALRDRPPGFMKALVTYE